MTRRIRHARPPAAIVLAAAIGFTAAGLASAADDSRVTCESIVIVGVKATFENADLDAVTRWRPDPDEYPLDVRVPLVDMFSADHDDDEVSAAEPDSVWYIAGEVWGESAERFAAQYHNDIVGTVRAVRDGAPIEYERESRVVGFNGEFGWTGTGHSNVDMLDADRRDLPGFWGHINSGRRLYRRATDWTTSVGAALDSAPNQHQRTQREIPAGDEQVWLENTWRSREDSGMFYVTWALFDVGETDGPPTQWIVVSSGHNEPCIDMEVFHVLGPSESKRFIADNAFEIVELHSDVPGVHAHRLREYARIPGVGQ